VILGLNQPLQYLTDSFVHATHPIVKGFMVGRTLWVEASQQWFRGEIDDAAFIDRVAQNFATLVEAWKRRKAH
jgi:5-dehydro-2-deoxygluconokinase